MSSTVTPMRLRSAIAETLWDCVKAHHLEVACDALGMAPAREGSAEPFNSKRSYVQGRLQGMSLTALTDLAYRVAAEYDPEHLQPLLDALGVHGVAGELKNLIFAADGPKPRIVLRDAVNNVIDIVENAQYCLVYDCPLAERGLTWRDLVKWWTEQHPGPGRNEITHVSSTTGWSKASATTPSRRTCSARTVYSTATQAASTCPPSFRRCICITTRTPNGSLVTGPANLSDNGWTFSCSCPVAAGSCWRLMDASTTPIPAVRPTWFATAR